MIAANHFGSLSSRRFVCIALSVMLLLVAIILRHPLTRTMALHMLVHIPLVVAAGALAARGLESHGRNRPTGPASKALAVYRRFDEYGVPGLLLASFAGAFWMIPRALDEVLSSPYADAWKFISLFAIGLVLRDALARAKPVIRLFFLGNFCWMAAVVGIVYQNIPSRLCNFYLASDQQVAGMGLVALSVLLPLAWLLAAWRRVRVFLRDT
ncbi:MAG TPA: hypothetical protein VFR20_04900 [Burkholderiaceae bacterium]|nr:hypothetical protein [Burkholderiaceae bacterium]